MDSPSEVDPWYRLAPQKVLMGWYMKRDLDIPHGELVHNYLDEYDLWS